MEKSGFQEKPVSIQLKEVKVGILLKKYSTSNVHTYKKLNFRLNYQLMNG